MNEKAFEVGSIRYGQYDQYTQDVQRNQRELIEDDDDALSRMDRDYAEAAKLKEISEANYSKAAAHLREAVMRFEAMKAAIDAYVAYVAKVKSESAVPYDD